MNGSSTIPIAEAELPTAELLAEQLNLFALVFDQLLLVAAQPHANPCRQKSHRQWQRGVSRLGLTVVYPCHPRL